MNSLEKNNGGSSCELTENLNFLRQTYFFSGLPLEALKVFAYLCIREQFSAGDFLFRQGDDDGQAFFFITGKAVVEWDQNGQTQKIRQVRTGEFLGGISLLSPCRRLFSLKAVEDTTCLVLSREKCIKTIEQFNEMTPKIFKAIIQAINVWEKRFIADRTDACLDCLPNLGVTLL